MKTKNFINEDALNAWDAMTVNEQKQIQGGEQPSDNEDDTDDNVSVTWSNSF